ncbi:methionine aminotransferase [Croceimicrobium sp.]|uniref:methionine aminotransferase n=1 Tax=Croceimicrobium sp. TaxID=2828340 RepID=UPI003BAC1949
MSDSDKPLSFSGNLSHVGETIFSKMTALAQKHKAVNLSQGFPDFPVDPALIERVHYYVDKGPHQYAPMAGHPAFREELCKLSDQEFNSPYNTESEICVTAGATQALGTALACAIREGDEVIVFSPAYDSYFPMIELYGGRPITIKLQHPDYSVDWDQVKRLISHRTKMIIINSPHNPSGRTWKEEDYLQLQELVSDSNILILADEVYEHLVFDPKQKRSVRQFPDLRKRSFVVGSLGKTVHVTGWKIGYCLAPENLMREFKKVHQYFVFSINHPLQWALADYLPRLDLAGLGKLFKEKHDWLLQNLQERTRFKALPSEGTYFMLIDYSDISQESEMAFAERLTTEFGVASIPLSPFYRDPVDHKVLRLCFAKDDQTLEKGVEALSKV